MLNFDADVKKTTSRHPCVNRLTLESRPGSEGLRLRSGRLSVGREIETAAPSLCEVSAVLGGGL